MGKFLTFILIQKRGIVYYGKGKYNIETMLDFTISTIFAVSDL